MFCCSSPAGQNFSVFEKKLKFDHMIECTCARDFVTDGSFEFVVQREVISGCTVLFGSRIINCSQEETFANLSRLEEDKFSESRKRKKIIGHVTFFFFFFYRPPGFTL